MKFLINRISFFSVVTPGSPMRNVSGNVNSCPVVTSRPKFKLLKSFQSAKSIDKLLKTFKEIEKSFHESDLAYGCWTIATELIDSPEQVLSFGNRALQIFIDNDSKNIPCFGNTFSRPPVIIGETDTLCTYYHKSSLYIAFVCNLLASACRQLKRYDEGLSYLNWANRNLTKLLQKDDDDISCRSKCLLYTLRANQHEMYDLKFDMGRFDEAVIPLRKSLEIEESVMEEGCIQLGKTNEKLCGTYMMDMNEKEALPFCLKALEIYTKHLGPNSVEVARMMRCLALVYNEFEKYEKALEQNQLSQNILKKMTPYSPQFFSGENDTGYILIGLGRYEEAIDVLNRVVSHTNTDGGVQGLSFVNMAKALYYLGKRAEAKRHLKTAHKILEKKETRPICAATGFVEMSMLYEKMNDFGKATSLLRSALSTPKIPQKLLTEGSARLFSLICLSGKEKEATAYMEDVVELLKHSFGPEHCEVGYCYRNLGASYLKLGQEELALSSMVKAKQIMDVKLGPSHLDSLKTSQMLAETYATMRRYDPAIEIQGKVVDGLKFLEPRQKELLDIAVKHLNKMKESVGGSRMGASSQSKVADDLSEKISKCGISDDEKVLE